jgi:hypothetical protein
MRPFSPCSRRRFLCASAAAGLGWAAGPAESVSFGEPDQSSQSPAGSLSNANVFRWRAPLYVAEVDRQSLRLTKGSEQIVLPLVGDGLRTPNDAAGLGNFNITAANERESWVTAAEVRPTKVTHGDTLLARFRWRHPNRPAFPRGST